MNQAFHLYRLQQIDTQIDQVANSLAGVERLLAGDETVRAAKEAVEEAEKRLRLAAHSLKQAEFSVKEQQVKIAQSESTLYGGKVRNPKELQDLQKEIASLKKHLATVEDHQLEAMMAVEEAEDLEKAARTGLEKTQAIFAEKSAGWLGQKDVFTRNLERLQAERSAALSLISPDSLRLYENMRKRKSGVAVTTVNDGSCSVCGASIRPSELQEARAAQSLTFCGSCGRILYAG